MSHLLLMTPAADPLVGAWRAEHDWAAGSGIGAHVTVRSPFLGVDAARAADVAAALGAYLPLAVTLARVEERPGALVVIAAPDEELWRLAHAASRAWPSLPPHKDGRPDAAFHMTVVRTADQEVRRAAAAAISPRLPVTVMGTELWVAEGSPQKGAVTAVLATAPD